jgi:hypothetical protein
MIKFLEEIHGQTIESIIQINTQKLELNPNISKNT